MLAVLERFCDFFFFFPILAANPSAVAASSTNAEAKEDDDEVVDKDVQPVGQDYIEEIKNEEGMFSQSPFP